MSRAFRQVDLILTPTTVTTAPPIGSEMIETTQKLMRLTYGWSLAGVPALSVPCGFSHEGLPVGLQFAAPRLQEAKLVQTGAAYQGLTDWHVREPPILQER